MNIDSLIVHFCSLATADNYYMRVDTDTWFKHHLSDASFRKVNASQAKMLEAMYQKQQEEDYKNDVLA